MSGYKQRKFKPNKAKANLNAEIINFDKDDSLHAAIKWNKFQIVKQLVRKGVNVNTPGRNKLRPIHVAAKYGRSVILDFLIRNNACKDFVIVGSEDNMLTPLHLAVENNNLECARILLNYGARVSSQIEGAHHPIHFAVFNNQKEMAELLLSCGADVNLRYDNSFFEENEVTIHRSLWLDHNLPLLHYSIVQGFTEMTNCLLENGADTNLKSSLEKTTLMQAVEVNNMRLSEYLITRRNANVNDCDTFGQPVLHFLMLNANRKASMYSRQEHAKMLEKFFILGVLKKRGVNANARFPKDKERSTVVHYMIKYGYALGVEDLLNSPMNFNFNQIDLMSIYSGQALDQYLPPNIKNDFNYMVHLRQQFENITYYIVKKAIDYQMIGFPVDENLILEVPIHPWISMEEYTNRINSHKNEVMEQINWMKNEKISDSNITVWHLLTCKMHELVKLMSNKILKDFDVNDEDMSGKMISYKNIVEKRLHDAKQNKILRDKAKEVVFYLFIKCLPYDCCERIVNYLSYEELTFLC